MPTEPEIELLRTQPDFSSFKRVAHEMGYDLHNEDYFRINRLSPQVVNVKKRHLTQDERQFLHRPASDWVESKKGDMCKNACAVEVKDIVEKYNKKTTA